MRYVVLGGVGAVGARGWARLGNRLERLLAVLLAHRNDEVERDTLIAAVWDGSPEPSRAEDTLRLYVSRLRAALRAVEPGHDQVRTTPRGYRLDAPPGSVDVDAARDELDRAWRAGALDVVRAVIDRDGGRPFGAMSGEWWCRRAVEHAAEQRRRELERLLDELAGPGRAGARRPVARDALPASLAARRDGELLGRAPELARLEEAVARVRGGGGQATVSISGPAGMGSSRLAAELAWRSARRGGFVLHGGFDPDVRTPFLPFARALSCPPAGDRPSASRVVAGLPARARALLGLGDAPVGPAGAPWQEGAACVADALAVALAGTGAAEPAVLVVEDLQWADRASAAALAQLVVAARPSTVLVTTHRTEPVDATAGSATLLRRLALAPSTTRVELGPLPAGAAAALVGAVVGPSRAAAVTERLLSATGGHPLLLRAAAEAAAVGATGAAAAGGGAVPLPARAFVAGRLALLSPAARRTVELAAVAGPSVSLEELVVAGVPPTEALHHLDDAAACGLVVELPAGPRGGGPGRHAFRYPLVREAVHEGLAAGRRRELRAHLGGARARRPCAPTT